MKTNVFVNGLGLWMPGVPGVEAWRRGERGDVEAEPASALLNPRLRRRTSMLTRMSMDAAEQAARQAGADLTSVPALFASAYGEAGTSIELLEQLHSADGALSPTRFHNSVHNTAAGYFGIACQNRSFCTSIAAGWQTLAMALLEAWGLLAVRGGEALLVIGEERLPPPLDRAGRFDPMAVAFHLSSERREGSLARLGAPMLADHGVSRPVPEALRASPASVALPLLEAVLDPVGGAVRLEPGNGAVWTVDVNSPENAPSPASPA